MQPALRNHLRQPDGRAALAEVLMGRQSQWSSPITNRLVGERLVGMLTTAFDALESGAAMDRVTGMRTFSSESKNALSLVEMGQVYVLQYDAESASRARSAGAQVARIASVPDVFSRAERAGDAVSSACLLTKLKSLRVWSDMRLWHAMVESAIAADTVSRAEVEVREYLHALGEGEHTATVVEALGAAQYDANTWLDELKEMQRNSELGHFLTVCKNRSNADVSATPQDNHAAEVEIVRLLSNCS
jgi:hypothetical protein